MLHPIRLLLRRKTSAKLRRNFAPPKKPFRTSTLVWWRNHDVIIYRTEWGDQLIRFRILFLRWWCMMTSSHFRTFFFFHFLFFFLDKAKLEGFLKAAKQMIKELREKKAEGTRWRHHHASCRHQRPPLDFFSYNYLLFLGSVEDVAALQVEKKSSKGKKK